MFKVFNAFLPGCVFKAAADVEKRLSLLYSLYPNSFRNVCNFELICEIQYIEQIHGISWKRQAKEYTMNEYQ